MKTMSTLKGEKMIIYALPHRVDMYTLLSTWPDGWWVDPPPSRGGLTHLRARVDRHYSPLGCLPNLYTLEIGVIG